MRWENHCMPSDATGNNSLPNDAKNAEEEEEVDEEVDGEVDGEGERAAKPPTRYCFFPPTLDDVMAYCTECGYFIDPHRFVDYYTANGWRVGKNPMRDWKAAVRTWAKNEKTHGKAATYLPEDDLNGIF